MSSIATSFTKSLPKPKYSGENEELAGQARSRGPRVVGQGGIDESQIAIRRTGPPPYGSRAGWRPRSAEDFGDGGAFPEIPFAQYPLDMGRKTTSSSNALTVQMDGEGKVKYDAIARRGHSDKRVIQSQFKDLIPLRQQANAGELSLNRPSEEEVAATREKTQLALAKLVSGAAAAQRPKNVPGTSRPAPTYVSYTPDDQMGDQTGGKTRIIQIVQRQQDPMEPPKHKHKKIPRGPPSPPPPVLHSPPRKLTAEDQEMWRIPPPVSNWKNPKGYTVPLDKRLAADGRGLQDVTLNSKFANFADALQSADRLAREEVRQRQQMQQKLSEKEKLAKEENLRGLAAQAREEKIRAQGQPRGRRGSSSSYSSSRSRSGSNSEVEARRERERVRREKKEEHERELRRSRMGTERKMQQMARDQGRDISEKVALGLAKPSQSAEGMYDSRLFNQTSGFDSGFNEDQAYDKPLFAAQNAIGSIYRPGVTEDDEEEDGGQTLENIQKANRFDVLGKAGEKGFKGAKEAERRDGPVQFERAKTDRFKASPISQADPFGIDAMINEVTGSTKASDSVPNDSSGKRYGLSAAGERAPKRARVDDD